MEIKLSRNFLQSLVLQALVALPLYLALHVITGNWLIAGALAGMLVAFGNQQRRNYVLNLRKRFSEPKPVEWTVNINDVKVGTISDSELAAINLQVLKKPRNYAAQISNSGRVIFRVFDYCYAAIPVTVFWIAVALAIASPEIFYEIVTGIQKSGAAAIAAAAVAGFKFLGLLMVMVLAGHVIFGFSRFGFINHFAQATNEIVRKRCGVPTEGNMVLVREDNLSDIFMGGNAHRG